MLVWPKVFGAGFAHILTNGQGISAHFAHIPTYSMA